MADTGTISNSLIGLFILLVIAGESLILHRRKTIPVILLDQIIIGLLVSVFFGKFTLIYSGLLIAFLMFIKYRDHIDESSDLDYSGRILSVSAVINKFYRPSNLVIGRVLPNHKNEIKYNQRPIELDDTILSGETLVTGSTGSGKTTTLKTIIKQRMDEQRPVVFVDYKGEEDILDEIQEFAYNAGLPYYEFSNRQCTFTYDPFINLNETGKVEALMNTRRWSTDGADEHYKTSMQLACQSLIRNYDAYRQESNEKVNYIYGLYQFSKTYRPVQNERDGFNNLQKSLEILLTSKANELFGNEPSFTFEREDAYVICFSFTSANKALANQLSSFIFTDIMDRGTRHKYADKLLLCVDEFGTLDSSTLIKDLLEKGRSGGVQTVFSILDLNQIAMNAGEHFVQAILGTINNYIIHAGATQQTAELLAGVQKFDKSYDIMSLRKPYKGALGTFKPTALFISKYPIFNKKGTQEVYRIIPYSEILANNTTTNNTTNSNYECEEQENCNISDESYLITPPDELDLSKPIDDISKYL